MCHREADSADDKTSCKSRRVPVPRAAHRLEQQFGSRQGRGTETGREAKFYALTAAGRTQLTRELESWERLSTALGWWCAKRSRGQR